MFDYDPMADANRYCVYCRADCWPEVENQRHDVDCPRVTGIYPVTSDDLNPWGGYGDCSACHVPFERGNKFVLVDVTTGTVTGPRPDAGFVMCLGCAALGGDGARPAQVGGTLS